MDNAITSAKLQNRGTPIAGAERAPWGEALLAGSPHLLYAIAAYGFQWLALQPYRTANGYLLHPASLVFWGLISVGLAFAWRTGWPRWSATWIGYATLLLAELLLVLPTTGRATREGTVIFWGILWVLIAIGILVLTTRRDWLGGFLAVLPLMPMWYSYLALDGVAGNEAPLFYAIGLLMAAVVVWIVRQGSPLKGMGWITAALLLVGLAVSYATVYFSNISPPVGTPPAPTPRAVISSLILFLLGYVVVSCPVWVTAIIRMRKASSPGA